MLKLSSYVSGVYPKVLKLSSDVSECKPLVAGELDDPRGEFFVVSDPAVSEEDLWRHRYRLDHDMRPPFISEATAADILRIGKSINFLRRCCDDDSWAEERAPVAGASTPPLFSST